MKNLHIIWALCLLFGSSSLLAQTTFYEDTPDLKGSVAVCAYGQTALYGVPGRNGDEIGTVLFGEELVHMGREATVKGEGPSYLLVETTGGQRGWVRSSTVEGRAGLVVVVGKSKIYNRPSTSSAATNEYFDAGEIAILTDFRDNWVKLVSEGKDKSGWISGYSNLSVTREDVEVAGNLRVALSENERASRRDKLRRILSTRSQISPEMKKVIDQRIQETYASATVAYEDPGTPSYTTDTYPPDQYYPGGEDAFAGDLNLGDLGVAPTPNNNSVYRTESPAYLEQEVVDAATGQSYYRVTQMGSIQPVKAKNPKTIYYAYHKSLPIGTQILLEVPSHPGKFVPLTVIAQLRSDNPNLIGLGSEVLQKVYGVERATDAPLAKIVYRKM